MNSKPTVYGCIYHMQNINNNNKDYLNNVSTVHTNNIFLNSLFLCWSFIFIFYHFGSKIRTRIITFHSNIFTNASRSTVFPFFSLFPSMCPSPSLPFLQLAFSSPVLSIQPEDIFKSIHTCAFSHSTLQGSGDGNNIIWWNFTST